MKKRIIRKNTDKTDVKEELSFEQRLISQQHSLVKSIFKLGGWELKLGSWELKKDKKRNLVKELKWELFEIKNTDASSFDRDFTYFLLKQLAKDISRVRESKPGFNAPDFFDYIGLKDQSNAFLNKVRAEFNSKQHTDTEVHKCLDALTLRLVRFHLLAHQKGANSNNRKIPAVLEGCKLLEGDAQKAFQLCSDIYDGKEVEYSEDIKILKEVMGVKPVLGVFTADCVHKNASKAYTTNRGSVLAVSSDNVYWR